MTPEIAFNANICFTGAPVSGLEESAISIHRIAEAATSCGIQFFRQEFWIDPDSGFLGGRLENAQELFLVVEALLDEGHMRPAECGFYLLRGPLDVMTLAALQGITLPHEFSDACAQLVRRMQLFVFQLPDRDGWRSRGYDARRVSWFSNYTKTLFTVLRKHGLQLGQFRVLPPHRGDIDSDLVDACWRVFGIAPNPMSPNELREPLGPVSRGYQDESKSVFDAQAGSPFGPPRA